MKIKTLIENTACRPGLRTEAGLSMYLETERHKILFDTGMTGDFVDNARELGVDLEQVDLVVISHGHDDHGGGLKRFLEINHTAPVYINAHAFRPFYARQTKDLSLDKELAHHPQVVITGDSLAIDEGVELFTCNGMERKHKMGHFGLSTLSHGAHIPDDFRHEQYLLLTEGGKRVLLSGCSHKGILNLMEWVPCDVLLGGFHFMRMAVEGPEREELEQAGRRLKQYPTTYYTCHCTGLEQYGVLKQVMGEQLQYAAGGSEIEI